MSITEPAVLGDISPKQELSIREATVQVCIWEGAIRSSKTIAQILRFFLKIPFARGGRIVIMGRTRESIYRNIIEPMLDPDLFGELAKHVKYNPGAPIAKILGRTVHIIGANDKQAEDKIRGMTVALVLVDEITVLPEGAFKTMLGRLTAPNAQLFGSTNPDSSGHWLKTEYLDVIDSLPHWRSWHFMLDDNIALSEETKNNLKANYKGLWYKRFIEGLWVAAEGAVYDMWDADVHTVPWDELPPMHRILGVGVDWGATNATTGLMLGLAHTFDRFGQMNGSRLYLIDEFRYAPSQASQRMTNADLSAGMRNWMTGRHLPYNTALEPEYMIVDPSSASFKVQLQADGVQNVIDADNSVVYGITLMAALLGAGQLLVARPTEKSPDKGCPGLIKEFPGYSWDSEQTLKGKDAPMKVADHSLDGARYVVTTTESIWRQFIHNMAI